jgi:hypothetical protein
MDAQKREYVKNVVILALGGGIVGGLIGTYAPKKKTTGNTAFGVALGAGLTTLVAGFAMRTGALPGAQFAGIGACPACVGRRFENRFASPIAWQRGQYVGAMRRPQDCIAVGSCQG